jgi:hypothetical protein
LQRSGNLHGAPPRTSGSKQGATMKTTLHSWRGRAAVLLAALAAPAATPAGADKVEVPMSAYQPLAFLVGHCWRGTFPDGRATDEHCFSWIYGGRVAARPIALAGR